MSNVFLKSAIRKTAASLYYGSKMQPWRHRGRVLILAYHRVLPQAAVQQRYVQPGMYVLDTVFDEQAKFLRENFQILSFPELLERWRSKNWDKHQRYCVITFDDGWLDNYLYAYPILKKHGLPATLFLATDFIGTDEWFWPEKMSYLLERFLDPGLTSMKKAQCYLLLKQILGTRQSMAQPIIPYSNGEGHILGEIIEQCKKLPSESIQKLIDELAAVLEIHLPEERLLLNWSEVAQMSQGGISFGSHSCSHRILTKLPWHEVKRELDESNQALQKERVKHVPVFCYPNGDCNQDVQNLVRDCGYQAAVGVRRGSEGKFPQNLFELNRIGVHNDITSTIPLFALHILGPL